MTPLWTSAAIAAATGGTASVDFAAGGVTFDSREVIGGELFVAMPGETTDGHRFVDMAATRGAAGMLVSQSVVQPHVLVADVAEALGALGAAARDRSAAVRVGVTGSVGKTGVKEALRLSFERFVPGGTHASVKSYNNHTGVPLSLARMPAASRFGVFEMGMNHAGEIAALTAQVRPHVALVTAIAPAHIENLRSEEAIADAKGEIFAGLMAGGTAIVPFDSAHRDRLLGHARAATANVLTFGEGEGADVRVLHHALHADCTTVTADVAGETLTYKVGMAGRHWLGNSLAVLAGVKAAGGDLALAGLALAELSDLPGRGKRSRIALASGGQGVLIDESYNANPASMAASLAVLGATPANRRIAVLGAMKELGDHGPAFHAGLAPAVIGAGVARAILVGKEMTPLADALRKQVRVEHVDDAAQATAALTALLADGDVLLVKGSNSVGLGKVVAQLMGGDA